MTPRRSEDRLSPAQADRFKALTWPHVDALLRTARYLARNQPDAEDLVQETMLKAMRSIETFQQGTDAKAWLMAILRNTHIDRLRAQKRRGPAVSVEAAAIEPAAPDDAAPFEAEPAWDGVNPDALLSRIDDAALAEALTRLPDEMRWTLLLVDVEQLDHRAAAEVLGVAEGTIKSRASRGRAMLREQLMDLAKLRGWVGEPGS